MTHTLHRIADISSAKSEFLIIGMATKGVNFDGSKERLVRILEICEANGAVNLGDTQQGSIFSLGSKRTLFKRMVDGAIAGALFNNKGNLSKALQKIKEEDLGMSIVVTGDIHEIKRVCKQIEAAPHTIALSLGIKGRRDKLPSEDYLKIMTMCGHGLVPEGMIRTGVDEIQKQKTTVEKEVVKMAECCVCGCFNPESAKTILARMI